MPAYRTGPWIGEAIGSVLAQTMGELELIVVDDSSPDDTLARARAAAGDDPRVIIMALETNAGAAAARNAAIRAARGRYIAFLDSDDLWYPDKLERQLAFMARHALGLAYGQYDVISEQGEAMGTRQVPDHITYAQLLRCCPIGCLTVVYDSEALGQVHMPALRQRQDWATWLAILRQAGPARGQNGAMAAYRVREGSLSHRKARLLAPVWAVYHQDQRLPLLRSAGMMGLYMLNGMLRARVPGFINKIGFL